MPDKKTLTLAKKIWDYHHLNMPLKKADAILVLGSHDLRVAEYAAKLFLKNYAPYIIFSGQSGRLTSQIWKKSEAAMFADVAKTMGVPLDKILIEDQSKNTGQNIINSKKLLQKLKLKPKTIILVQKPYMERRAWATFKKVWPKQKVIVTSPKISFTKYPDKFKPLDQIINIIVGDLQRIKLYPKKGFQIKQEIPQDVWRAYEKLIAQGYNHHLAK
ncbi:MAG: YdcF family protein [Candidatus Buchananbacteria bacterium]